MRSLVWKCFSIVFVYTRQRRPSKIAVTALSAAPVMTSDPIDSTTNSSTRYGYLFRWKPTSKQELEEAERKVLSFLRHPFKTYYVDIGNGWREKNNKIWTLEMTPDTDPDNLKTPIVLVHGFAAALGLWSLNLDAIAATNRKVYAFDLIGFGKSSRPPLNEVKDVEDQLVASIERWRAQVGLDQKFILLGHSFGAYLSAAYALKHPEHIAHLVMADPWGMPHEDTNRQFTQHTYTRPWWVRFVAKAISVFTPLAGLRMAGPWGPQLVYKLRSDIRRKFENVYGEGNADCFLEYIYHCNVQGPRPAGERAFKALATGLGWARRPMVERLPALHPDLDLTFIYGSRSWIDRQPGFQVKYLLGDRVSVHVIQGSGHHVYADRPDEFNEMVAKVCDTADTKYYRPTPRMVSANREVSAERSVPREVVPPLVD